MAATIVASTPMYLTANEICTPTSHRVSNNDKFMNLSEINFDNDQMDIEAKQEGGDMEEAHWNCYHVLQDEEGDEVLENYKCLTSQVKWNKMSHRGVPKLQFDSDSFPIGIDTFASMCMSPSIDNFIPNTLQKIDGDHSVQAYGKDGPRIPIKMRGTLAWKIEDDGGRVHTLLIPNALYVPGGNMRLLSPQHWAATATAERESKSRDRVQSIQLWNRNILRWGSKSQYRKTIHNNKRSRVPIMYSAPGTQTYRVYQAKVQAGTNQDYMTCFASNMVSDDEDSVQGGADSSREAITPSTDPTPAPTPMPAPRTSQAPSDLPTGTPRDNSQTTPTELPTANPIEVEEANNMFVDLEPRGKEDYQEETELLEATTDQGELMRWHYRLGHLSFKKLKIMAKLHLIPSRLEHVWPPKCSGCIYGKMHRKSKRSKGEQKHIRVATKPGQCVSVDQMESLSIGFVGQLKGKLTTRRYKYATVFVDHFSRYTYVHLQSSIDSEETLQAKLAFEAQARSMGVHVLSYHADNGRFADNLFLRSIRDSFQTITFCGVNAHWQNGIAKRTIRSLREQARTQLLHAIERWPVALSMHLWPFALTYSSTLHNQLPDAKGESPLAKFSNAKVAPNLNHTHAFGCPVYALDNNLQSGNHLQHWNPRARLGAYLGPLPRHAKTVSMVLNLTTGLVSPQFHVQHDEFFETVQDRRDDPKAPWYTLAGLNRKDKVAKKTSARESVVRIHRDNSKSTEIIDGAELGTEEGVDNLDEEQASEEDKEETNQTMPVSISRSGRVRKPSQRLQESEQGGQFDYSAFSARHELDQDEDYYYALHQDDYKLQEQMDDPIAFKATSDPDTMYYHQAMREPDRNDFLKAIVKEVNDHIEGNHWKLVPRSKIPKGAKVLDSVWAMKRKRDIKTRQVYKHKARLNIHGGQQEYGTHYTETFSPVVKWFSVRLLLIIAKLNNYHTRQIDFVLAYLQADLPFENYMNLPHGISTKEGNGKTHVLKLLKNIYGGRNSGRIWNDYLKEGLINIGFQQSKIDECVFYRGGVIFFFYVDDGIFISKVDSEIDEALADLSNPKKAKNKYKIDDQGEITDYLGINFDKGEDNKFKLWQPHLIDQIIEEVGVSSREKAKPTPAASTKPLSRLKEEPEARPNFDYRRVIGKLNYLEKSSRPDIAYAVHQCARFCSGPREQHVQAVRHLARYLKGTRNKGITIDPKPEKSFEVWVDADFSGNYNKITAQSDPSTSKSRSGYVITYAGVPITWVSKLQTQIALSTCEAEYISLSQSLRDTIPMMDLLQELKDYEFEQNFTKPKIRCTVFEDNTGALALATVPKVRPRTKHINLVYHHFREYVREGVVTVHHVDTESQIGDMFTKPLPQNLFVKFRKMLLRW